ncbi:MAG: FMN-binding protein [Myxococcota bacterium]|nr:FMN-binding protein [Myxococcota bacterium]
MKASIKIGYLAAIVGLFLMVAPKAAMANKYMSLKEAIKYFLPEGSKLSKVSKTIPDDKFEATKKRFRLKKSTDFKEKISKGPYTIYVGRDAGGSAKMYILMLDQYWRTCYHKYAIGIEPNGTVKEVVVVDLNCKFAYPINRKSFLKQFKGKNASNRSKAPVEVGKDIDAVSGATASSDATAIVTRRALALFELFFASK